jgi:putative transcriptional regulator
LNTWGHSSAGRALQWHCRGQRFDPAWLHQKVKAKMKNSFKKKHSLKGQLLLALPHMRDEIFDKSAILICSHDKEGAVGIIINRPLESVTFLELMAQFQMKSPKDFSNQPVFFGGPVDVNRGFILHTTNYVPDISLKICEEVALTASLDFFKTFPKEEQKEPIDILIALGYAGWGPGQLEEEIKKGSWVHVPATKELLFGVKSNKKWEKAIKKLGIQPQYLSWRTGSA